LRPGPGAHSVVLARPGREPGWLCQPHPLATWPAESAHERRRHRAAGHTARRPACRTGDVFGRRRHQSPASGYRRRARRAARPWPGPLCRRRPRARHLARGAARVEQALRPRGAAWSAVTLPAVIDDPAQLKLSEKAALTGGVDLWHTAAIERLGIPALRLTDG